MHTEGINDIECVECEGKVKSERRMQSDGRSVSQRNIMEKKLRRTGKVKRSFESIEKS